MVTSAIRFLSLLSTFCYAISRGTLKKGGCVIEGAEWAVGELIRLQCKPSNSNSIFT
jgi:hypothetical protein